MSCARTFKVKSAINDVRTLKVADLAEARIALVTLIVEALKNGLTITWGKCRKERED